MKRFLPFVLLLLIPHLAQARARTQGWCQNGNQTVTVPGGLSASPLTYQQSFPSCTVTVYLTGTVTLASIYADDAGTGKANPFTAATSGQWFFYADDGRYDVKFSGGGITTPFTLGDFPLIDPYGAAAVRDCTSSKYGTGADIGVRIAACIADLPSGGGIADATRFSGAQSLTSNPFSGTAKSVQLLLGATTISTTAVIDITGWKGTTILGLSNGGPSITDASVATVIKAVAGFPATSPIITYAPGSETEAVDYVADLMLDCNSIAQDGIYLTKFDSFIVERINAAKCTRYGFAFAGAGSSSNAVGRDLYANGNAAGTAPYYISTHYSKFYNLTSDSGNSTATSLLIDLGGSDNEFHGFHLEGGSICIEINGGVRNQFFGGDCLPQSGASQTGLKVDNNAGGNNGNRFFGTKFRAGTPPAGSIGVNVLAGAQAPPLVLDGIFINGFHTGVSANSSGFGNTVSLFAPTIDAVTTGVLITGDGVSIYGGQITTAATSINQTGGNAALAIGTIVSGTSNIPILLSASGPKATLNYPLTVTGTSSSTLTTTASSTADHPGQITITNSSAGGSTAILETTATGSTGGAGWFLGADQNWTRLAINSSNGDFCIGGAMNWGAAAGCDAGKGAFAIISNHPGFGTQLPTYANNAAALAGGLIAGQLYRTGANPDPVMIVH